MTKPPDDPPIGQAPSAPSGWLRAGLFALALVPQLVGLVALFVGESSWRLDLVTHWPHALALAGFGCALIAGWLGARKCVLLFGLCAVCWGLRWRHGLGNDPVAVLRAQQLSIVLLNVQMENQEHGRVIELLMADPPDLVCVVEVDERWTRALGALQAQWPHRLEVPRPNYSGIAVYSRLPLKNLRPLVTGTAHAQALAAELEDGTTLWMMHPPAPKNRWVAERRDAQLAVIKEQLLNPRVIVIGDLNVTPWSPHFPANPDLNTSTPFGTWPSNLPGWLRIPLDHVLVGDELSIASWELLADVGSDHRPLRVVVNLPSNENSKPGR